MTQTQSVEQRIAYARQYIGNIFGQPWMQDVIADIERRQPKSNQVMSEMPKYNVTSPGFWPTFAVFKPVCMERAQGGRFHDLDGNEYLDFFLSFGAQALHGHNPEPVVSFVKEQLGKSVGNGNAHPLLLEHAKLLKELMPHREAFAYQHSGSDATTTAVRLARAHTGRRLVVRFEGTVNGQYDMTSYNAHPNLHGYPILPYPEKGPDGIELQSFNKGAQVFGKDDLLILTFNDPASLDIIKKRKDEIACVLTEPIPFHFPFPNKAVAFTRELGEVCKRSNVLLVLDEVHSGFRYGISGVTGAENLHADLVTYGKVITGLGLPLSAIGGRADVLAHGTTSGNTLSDYGNKTFIPTTHINNHLSIAASYASLSLLKSKGEAYYTRTRAKARRIIETLESMNVGPKAEVHMYGCGDFYGLISFTKPHEAPNTIRDVIQATNSLAGVVFALLLRRKGIYFKGAPYLYTGDAHSPEEIETALTKMREAVEEMKQNNFPFIYN